ncbi:copper-translocating P-type ATPase [Exophiala oligosperma]|uniref:Copper-translocating P-type ATPase n=1 Tax=Exophiala oligosperma TaxID=215243 RepID=A0A0D2D716_9EURO|nr:copper-translocating P-type ATPase [Exophiala oligosperma]KIW38200.1 copper-translocating P-type ATPase [Exophiala oligosperma]
MSTSSNSEVSAAVSSGIRQRTCLRVACVTPLREIKCCDDTCLVEIARRDCSSEPNHKQQIDTKPSHDVLNDSAIPSQADEEPCQSHYLKAKEAYSAILDNMGCICKVLLSLNLDSCCVALPVGPLCSKRSTRSTSKGLSADMSMLSSTRSPCEPQEGADCSKDACCSEPSSIHLKEGATSGVTCNDTNEASCCTGEPSKTSIDQYPGTSVAKLDDSCKAGCGIKTAHTAALGNYHNLKTGSGSGIDSCCSGNLDLAVLPSKLDDCAGKECWSDNMSEPATGQTITEVHGNQTIDNCCADRGAHADAISDSHCTSDLLGTVVGSKGTRYTQATGTNELDLEKGDFPVEHVVLSIQGMTCTGCEKKLYRSLDMIPEISNVKTSLLLAQAEFDLSRSSVIVDALNTIKAIEKMTGFTCTKMTQTGHELDLIVDGLASEFAAKELPPGVSNIAVLDTHTIRVTYHPKLVGARDLMSDPYFQSPKLAPAADRPLIASGRAHVRLMLFKTIVSTVLTIPVLVMAWAPLPEHEVIYGAVSLVLATVVQVYIAGPWYISAFNALFFSRLIEMDLLVVLSTTTAYIYSIIAYAFLVSEKPLSTGSFFGTSTLLVTLIIVGRLVSGFARQRAVESISIESLQSSTAVLTDPKTHEEQEIDARLLQYQDIFKALPDTSIATDGTVIAGTSEVDESMITGEATLVAKKPGSPVVAGSINHSGTLTIRLSRLPGENTIKAIGLMVDEAKSSKTKIQEMADRVATYFIPVILVVTVLVFVVWVAIGKVIRGYDATTTCINAMTYAISALIVSCPCAIGLAVPMVLVVAGGVAAKHGLIFKTAETIEIARNLSHVIFDKTGTLTQGLLAVEAEIYPTKQGDILGPMLLGLTNSSKHPVSAAIVTHLKSSGVQPEKVEKVVSIAGSGIEATWNGSIIRAGNPHWLGIEDSPSVKETLLLGVSMFCVLVNGELVAVFGLKDLLRPDAIQVINELKKRSVEISIVSGDNQESVKSVASVLNVPESHVRFRCSPADKQMYVKQMLAPPKSVVMFCGDGTNDAVALAQASIGMHIDGGTDIAQSAADAVLVRPALSGIIILMDLSKAFFRRVVFNFSWSFIYNTFAILLAAGAFPNARIPPEFAGLGEIVSVLPVIAIGMQLKWAKFHQPE